MLLSESLKSNAAVHNRFFKSVTLMGILFFNNYHLEGILETSTSYTTPEYHKLVAARKCAICKYLIFV